MIKCDEWRRERETQRKREGERWKEKTVGRKKHIDICRETGGEDETCCDNFRSEARLDASLASFSRWPPVFEPKALEIAVWDEVLESGGVVEVEEEDLK